MYRTYESTKDGKRAFVAERLEPLMIGMDNSIESVSYAVEEDGHEYVTLKNKNPDKTLKVCVSCDSILALVEDVTKKYFKLEYTRDLYYSTILEKKG